MVGIEVSQIILRPMFPFMVTLSNRLQHRMSLTWVHFGLLLAPDTESQGHRTNKTHLRLPRKDLCQP